ncbi:MAG: efflux RND transporter periplasmic adaptor subunit [Planctomycetaceae bacterium]|nr:efflux RND transporter periplasmic adaptor subunit [Planctomycetaceae bacterium]
MRRELGKVARAAARMHRPFAWRSPLRRDLWPMVPYRSAYRCWLLFGLLPALAVPGCGHEARIEFTNVTKPTTVQVINPTVRNIVRVVGQPSFIESYERTSIYPKPTAYIQNWIVDIGDKVKKGDVLAILFAPELIEEYGTKQANVVLDQQRIALAKEVVEVAKADVAAAVARVKEAEEILDKYQAEVERWDIEVKRLQREAERGVVDPRVLLESTNQLKSSTAARDKAMATIKRAKAELLSAQATLAKAEVDVRVAEADLKVAESEERYAKAWVDYLTLTAPFDGLITARNANTYDFVLPTTGDPTAFYLSPDISPGGAAPIYVVDRTDIVRIFVDVPEQDANYVHIGSKATVLAKAYRDQPIPGTVTRISWALNMKSRTLRAEIDLPNPGSQLLPGMYAYGKVIIERPGVRALPLAALTHSGDQTFCWIYDNGHAVRTEIRTGVSDREWIEVTNLQRPAASHVDQPWTPINGSEKVILGDLSILADGAPVEVAPTTGETKVASATPIPGRRPTTTRSGAQSRSP